MTEQPHNHQIRIPLGILIAAGILILLTISAVAAFRISGMDPIAQVPSADAAVETRKLRFEDRPEGTVVVYQINDDAPEQIVHVVQPGEGGFIRGVLRSMARSRRADGISRENPFHLIVQPDGSLLLEDPSTDHRIYLHAFGPTNVESFRMMLSGGESVQ